MHLKQVILLGGNIKNKSTVPWGYSQTKSLYHFGWEIILNMTFLAGNHYILRMIKSKKMR
jgi:hypothetical protein